MSLLAMVGALGFEVPVDPDADQARRWLEDELAGTDYQGSTDLLTWIRFWLESQLDKLQEALNSSPGGPWLLVVVGLLIAGVIITLIIVGPIRTRRRAVRSAVVLQDETRSAAELLASARAHASVGAWAQAYLDYFRAIVRSLEERTILDDKPGRTAHEVPHDAHGRLPGFDAELRQASDTFDRLAYGDGTCDSGSVETIAALEGRIRATRPAHLPEPAEVQA